MRLGWEQHQIFRKLHYLGLNPYNTFVSEQSVTNEAFLFFVLIVTFIKKKKKPNSTRKIYGQAHPQKNEKT